MTRGEAREKAELMLAYANGSDIQEFDSESWYDLDDPNFSRSIDSYRVKPSTWFVYTRINRDGSLDGGGYYPDQTDQMPGYRKFKEVIE